MMKCNPIHTVGALAAAGLLATATPVRATEGGTSLYPNGTEGYMLGALPPPGLYGMVYGNHYHAGRVNDAHGNDLKIPGFQVSARVLAARLAWVPGSKIGGGDLVAHVIVPMVHLRAAVPGASQSRTGIGDLTTGLGLGFHHSPHLHSVVALDLFLPTGRYTPGAIANIGKNHWGVEPVYALSYIDPRGFNGDIKLGYTFNGRNKGTDYTSGHEFHFDYAAGWGLGNGWTVGVGGYYYRQMTSDKRAAGVVPDSRGRAMSMGPNIKYDSGKGWFATLKWEREFGVRNRAQGEALWMKAAFPF